MSAEEVVARLVRGLEGRRFVGLAELESMIPVGVGLPVLEAVMEHCADQQIIVVDEQTEKPVGYYPHWDPELWRRGRLGEVEGTWMEENLDALHARAHGVEVAVELEEGEAPAAPATAAAPMDEGEEEEAVSPKALYLDAVKEWGKLEPEEEERYLRRALAGDAAAREAVLESYLGRVIWHVRRYAKAGAQWEDLVQAGNLGLLEAMETWNPEGSASFRTFADRRVRRALARHLAEERRMIRLPRTVDKEIRRLLREDERLRKAGAEPPTRRDLARSLDLGQEEVAYLMSHLRAPLSLEGVAPGAEGLRLEEVLPDTAAPEPPVRALDRGVMERLDELLEDLSLSHRRVLALRFGLSDGVQRTRRQTSRKTGFSLDEVERLEEEALGRLRTLSGAERSL